jgi:ABC-type multidrug transport system ATPase subunit
VRDNLLTGAHLRGEKELVEQDLERIFSYFPVLGTAATKPASKMSGGEQQMIAIGRGLMGAPKLLLLDEPSLGLSPILTRDVGSIIKRIADEGVSILLIEQNANLALQLAQKCYVLETGSIALQGDSKDLQNNEHVRAAYLGIACAIGAPETPISSTGVRRKGGPQERPAKTTVDRWQEAKAAVQVSTKPLAGNNALSQHPYGLAETAPSRLDKLQTDMRLPKTSPPDNLAIGMVATDRLKLEGLKPVLATKAPSASLTPHARPERMSKVVKKVFTPKKG